MLVGRPSGAGGFGAGFSLLGRRGWGLLCIASADQERGGQGGCNRSSHHGFSRCLSGRSSLRRQRRDLDWFDRDRFDARLGTGGASSRAMRIGSIGVEPFDRHRFGGPTVSMDAAWTCRSAHDNASCGRPRREAYPLASVVRLPAVSAGRALFAGAAAGGVAMAIVSSTGGAAGRFTSTSSITTATATAADPNASRGHQRRARRLAGELGQHPLAQARARLGAHHVAHRAVDRRIQMRIVAAAIGHTRAPGPPSFPSVRGALPRRAISPCPPARRG